MNNLITPKYRKLLFTVLLSGILTACSGGSPDPEKQKVIATDTDGDGIPDTIDTDDDGDGVLDADDAFPLDANESVDADNDGVGNNADTDDDNDGVLDVDDVFPLDSAEWLDTDNDGIGNNTDTDDDNDGVLDADDALPLDSAESVDTDNDGIGNNADTDDDNDGVLDDEDAFPLNAAEWLDTDNDGIGNNADNDDDNDGVLDDDDAFPLDRAESVDTDNDGIGNNADTDDDNDGVLDEDDAFPLDGSESVDSDGDGMGDNSDVAAGDSGCRYEYEGVDGECFVTIIPKIEDLKTINGWGEIKYFYLPDSNQIAGYETIDAEFVVVYSVDANLTAMHYDRNSKRFYIAYADKRITYIDALTGQTHEFIELDEVIERFVTMQDLVIATSDNNSYVFSADGEYQEVDGSKKIHQAPSLAYHFINDRLFYQRTSDDNTGIKIAYVTFDQDTKEIVSEGSSAAIDASGFGQLYLNWTGQILLTQNQSQLFNTTNMEWEQSADVAIDSAFWMETNDVHVYTFDQHSGKTNFIRYAGFNGNGNLEVIERAEVDMQVLVHDHFYTLVYIIGVKDGRLVSQFYVAGPDDD